MSFVTVVYGFTSSIEFIYPGLMGLLLTFLFSTMITKEISKKMMLVMFLMAFLISLFGIKQDPLTYLVLGLSYGFTLFDTRLIQEFLSAKLRSSMDKQEVASI